MKVNFATAAFLAKLVIFRLEKNLRRNGTILAVGSIILVMVVDNNVNGDQLVCSKNFSYSELPFWLQL